jgi:hypothetical protein
MYLAGRIAACSVVREFAAKFRDKDVIRKGNTQMPGFHLQLRQIFFIFRHSFARHHSFNMNNRRSFIRQTAALLGSFALHQNVASAFPSLAIPQSGLGHPKSEDDFWRQIRMAYAASPTMINLNNGGVSPAPRATMDALDYYNRMCSEAPSY